jgi:hypothetical protein
LQIIFLIYSECTKNSYWTGAVAHTVTPATQERDWEDSEWRTAQAKKNSQCLQNKLSRVACSYSLGYSRDKVRRITVPGKKQETLIEK